MSRSILVFASGAMAIALLEPQPAHAVLDDFVGTYTGTWNNTTFFSSGPARLVTSEAGGQFQVTIDMDGNVYGQPDPPAVQIAGAIDAGDAVFSMVSAGGYGTVDGAIDGASGDISFTITGLLTAGITEVTAVGSFGNGAQLDLDYSVTFAGPPQPPAVGTLTVVKAPEPIVASGWLAVATLGALARGGRRAPASR